MKIYILTLTITGLLSSCHSVDDNYYIPANPVVNTINISESVKEIPSANTEATVNMSNNTPTDVGAVDVKSDGNGGFFLK